MFVLWNLWKAALNFSLFCNPTNVHSISILLCYLLMWSSWRVALQLGHYTHKSPNTIDLYRKNWTEMKEIVKFRHVLWFSLYFFQNIYNIYKDGDRPCVELNAFRDADDTHVEDRSIQAGHAVSVQNCGTWWKDHRKDKGRNQNYDRVAMPPQVS